MASVEHGATRCVKPGTAMVHRPFLRHLRKRSREVAREEKKKLQPVAIPGAAAAERLYRRGAAGEGDNDNVDALQLRSPRKNLSAAGGTS